MGCCLLVALILLVSVLSDAVNGSIAELGCDVFRGNWVSDASYPLYDSAQCPFLAPQFDCQGNGRPDSDYMKYKWKPDGCRLNRFDGVDFLKRMKGKNMIFVGDSLSLNQWQSLSCLLHVALPQATYTLNREGGLSIFSLPEHDVSLMFFRNAFLVDLTRDNGGRRVMMLDSISTSSIWGSKDVMIFDTWHWWLHSGRKQPWDVIVHGNTTAKDMDRLAAYEIALNTWAKWVDANVDTTKAKVFFQGVSPDHASEETGWCMEKTRPATGPGPAHPAEAVLEKVLKSMKKPVNLLRITQLSQLRIDGHPSYYFRKGHHGDVQPTDCTHWCLSGVPDAWNELLYHILSSD